MEQLKELGTAELRQIIRRNAIASGAAVSTWGKAECIDRITAALTPDQIRAAIAALADNTAPAPAPAPQTQTELFTAPAAAKSAPAAEATPEAVQNLTAALSAFLPRPGVDADAVRQICAEEVAAAVARMANPVRVEISYTDEPERAPKDLGVAHKSFPRLLALANCRDRDGHVPPVYLYGPAGTGKTTAARKLAEALELPFYYNGAIAQQYELSGFVNAAGTYVETQFYKAYSGGGVYLFDELDSSQPGAVLAFNAALANGHAAFPCGTVARHKDCIIIAAGNTCMRGDGAMAGFQRFRMDASFRDRFAFLDWPIDEELERHFAAGHETWHDFVLRCRRNAAAAGIKDFEVTPRATERGIALIRGGMDLDAVKEIVIRKGLPAELWAKVIA